MTNELEVTGVTLDELKMFALLKAFEMGQEAGRKNRPLVNTTKFNGAVQCANASEPVIRKDGSLRNMFIHGYMAEIKK